jgi:hypothetical protein
VAPQIQPLDVVMFTNEIRQETLFRGLVACFNTLGFVP